jgi:hypothetical protein
VRLATPALATFLKQLLSGGLRKVKEKELALLGGKRTMTAEIKERFVPQLPDAYPMFNKTIRQNDEGQVIIVGKRKPKDIETILNIPISIELQRNLRERIVGSLSLGSAALLEWALDELERQSISIEAQTNSYLG